MGRLCGCLRGFSDLSLNIPLKFSNMLFHNFECLFAGFRVSHQGVCVCVGEEINVVSRFSLAILCFSLAILCVFCQYKIFGNACET